MNLDKDLIHRLLRLLPVVELKKLVKDPKGKNQIILIQEIQNFMTLDQIKSELVKNYGYLKQHVYIFSLGGTLSTKVIHGLIEGHFNSSITKNYFFKKYIYKVKAIDNRPNGSTTGVLETIDVVFLQPCSTEIRNNCLIIGFTILEKSLNSYLPQHRIYEGISDEDEDSIVSKIESKLNGAIQRLDINKGVKWMWENDIIDSKYVTFKRTSSTTREVMDEDLTFKNSYPIDYKEVLNSPLQNTIFRVLGNQNKFCDFVSNPSEGTVSIRKYPDNINQIENVISEIIRKN